MGPWRKVAAKYGLASSISLPLRENGRVTGALTLYAPEPNAFDTEEVALLEEIAEDLAFGLDALRTRTERDRALQERKEYAERLRISLEDALQAIATTVEMRDPYTAGHQRRVAKLAADIARELGLPEEQVHGIHLASIVHDLGKIHIPAEILSKPAKLSDLEFSLIQTHPQAGHDILAEIDFPWPIAQAVLQHHERLDGSGYPNSIKGDAIIAEARIIAVSDVVEAMSSHRPYRPGLGIEAALEEIERHRGVRYDADAVDACIRLFRERQYKLPT
jgi:HD-GYP domain-containing protein (c-di-GMP phosphodiesterase class II)